MAKQPPKKPQGKAASKQLDAVQMLKADHKQVKKLFERFHAASGEERSSIANQLFTELEIHTILEEELFYPAVRGTLQPADAFVTNAHENGLDTSDSEAFDETEEGEDLNGIELETEEEDSGEELIGIAYQEHQAVKDLIEQLRTLDLKDADYMELFNELEEAVIEHIMGEEDVLLPLAATELDIQALGVAMQRRRDDLSSSLAA
jgi:hemerythrin superfamily protein